MRTGVNSVYLDASHDALPPLRAGEGWGGVVRGLPQRFELIARLLHPTPTLPYYT